MLKVPDTFRKLGFTYTKLASRGSWRVYAQERNGRVASYETVEPNIQKVGEHFGKMYPTYETYPSAEEWGTHGFTETNRGLAMAMLASRGSN